MTTFSYTQTLSAVAAGLTLKMAVTNLLTARCRTVGSEHGLRNDEDRKEKFTALTLFRIMLGGYGPGCDPDTMDRLISCSRNNTENEPYFLAAACGWTIVTTPPPFANAVLVSYMLSRYLHTFVYLFVRRQPFRALAWAPGALINIFISGQVLLSTSGVFGAAFNNMNHGASSDL